MIGLVEHELQRARWRRALELVALDREDRDDFASRGLAARLRTVTTQVLLLPSDPEASTLNLNDSLSNWLQNRRQIDLDRARVALPSTVRRTAHAMVIADPFDEYWASYLAVHRSGALECGLGDRGGWARTDRDGVPRRMVALTPLVARVWALLRIAAELAAERSLPGGSHQLTIGIRGAKGALLYGLGEGWAEPGSFENHLSPCLDEHLLWHVEIPDLPVEEGARDLAYSIGDRVEDAWGVAQRRYLAHRGDFAGALDPRHV